MDATAHRQQYSCESQIRRKRVGPCAVVVVASCYRWDYRPYIAVAHGLLVVWLVGGCVRGQLMYSSSHGSRLHGLFGEIACSIALILVHASDLRLAKPASCVCKREGERERETPGREGKGWTELAPRTGQSEQTKETNELAREAQAGTHAHHTTRFF